ncbi:MAG: hypothetical protein ACRDTX_18875 [Pseudonocardiaceae bacterium]
MFRSGPPYRGRYGPVLTTRSGGVPGPVPVDEFPSELVVSGETGASRGGRGAGVDVGARGTAEQLGSQWRGRGVKPDVCVEQSFLVRADPAGEYGDPAVTRVHWCR